MRKIPWALIILIIWMLLVSTGLYVYLFHLQPTKLGGTVSAYLKEKTNLEFSIESIGLSFSPSPAVIVNNAKFYDNALNTAITAKKVEGLLSWRSLFALKPVLKRLDIYEPSVHFVFPVREKSERPFKIEDVSEEASRKLFEHLREFSVPHYFNSLKITVHNGSGELFDPNTDMAYFFENLRISAKAPDILDGYAQIALERFDILYEKSPLIQLTDTKITADNVSYNPRTYSGKLTVESNIQAASLQRFYDTPIDPAYHYFPMPKPSFVRLNTDFSIAIRSREISLDGTLVNETVFPMNGHDTPVRLQIPFSMVSTFEKKHKSSLKFPYDDNTLNPYKDEFLKENILSDYALDLPGFYVSEIRINNAKIKADADSLDFRGALTGIYPLNPLFFGKADVHNFSLPRWIGPTRNMSAGLYNALNAIKAEIDVFCTMKGVFSPNLKAKVSGYDIRGKSVTANFFKPDICFDLKLVSDGSKPLDLNPLFPEINGKTVRRVKLPPPAVTQSTSSEDGGTSVLYHINIHVPKSARIWKIDCSDINVLVAPDKTETPTVAVDIKNLYTGKATALAVLNSDKKHKITAKINSVMTEAPLRNIIGYTACTGHADANLTLYLQGNNVSEILNSLEIYGQASVKNGALHSKTKMLSKFSKLFADVSVKAVPFKAAGGMPETFAMSGNWLFEGNFPEYAVKLSTKNSAVHFSTSDGQPRFRKPQSTDILLTEKPSQAVVLNGSGKLGFDLNQNSLALEQYKGMLRHSKLIANIKYTQKDKASYSGNLYFQHFDLSDYIKNDGSKISADKDLPLDFICSNDVDISLKADKLTFYDITTGNFTGNIKIKDNKISVNNLKASSHRGIIQALLEGSVTKHNQKYQMKTLFKLKAENIDMLAITKMRKQKTLMAGTGNIGIQGSALISKSSDIFKSMNADWNMNFFNGYFQSEKDHYSQNSLNASGGQSVNSAQYTGKTHYNTLSASGTIKNGIAETHNILFHGKGVDILAGGTVNLVTEAINAYARANYLGFSDIPIVITGTIENPKYEVKVLNAVSRSIGNIGAGIFDIFSNVITQPFKIFMQ